MQKVESFLFPRLLYYLHHTRNRHLYKILSNTYLSSNLPYTCETQNQAGYVNNLRLPICHTLRH